jgi:hypothetical protein
MEKTRWKIRQGIDAVCSTEATAIVAETNLTRIGDDRSLLIGKRVHLHCTLKEPHEGAHLFELVEEGYV